MDEGSIPSISTMSDKLSDFPVDDITLDAILHSLNGAFTVDEEGNHTLVGADYTLSDLLDFLSGYDKSKLIQEGPNIYLYPDPVYTEHCVIRALIEEIKRLRNTYEPLGTELL